MSSTLRTSSGRSIEYVGSAESLQQVWVAMRANLREVLEHVTVADVASGRLPKGVLALTRKDDAGGKSLAGRPLFEASFEAAKEDPGGFRRTPSAWEERVRA